MTLNIILGDQLDRNSPLVRPGEQFWMAEVKDESKHVWSHKARTALFFACMRHFAAELNTIGRVHYERIGQHAYYTLADALTAYFVGHPQCKQARLVRPGDYRVFKAIQQACVKNGVVLEVFEDPHFYTTPAEFRQWAEPRKSLRMEYFYRDVRRRFDILMDGNDPVGGQWNFDASNRNNFGKQGPSLLPAIPQFERDDITQGALSDTEKYFADHPGELEQFNWPVTRTQALAALDDFVAVRLHDFGHFQDAMWTGETVLYHSQLSAAMNLKLISPREVVDAAVAALAKGAPMNAVEGFVRQIIGWREYVRGIYWYHMPQYEMDNHFSAEQPLPRFFWTGDTDMGCLQQVIKQTLDTGYAHHIQRLMVTGLFCLLLGVRPKEVHEWYLAVYVDAVEWVEMPNTLGMSQYADGGLLASKPYVASGKYIERMSNYCEGCRFNPALRTGDSACPFTTLYWDFLLRHEAEFEHHPRMALQVRNVQKIAPDEQQAIRAKADQYRASIQQERKCSSVA